MSPALLTAEQTLTAEHLRRRVRAALERDPADLVLAGARLVNVYSEEIHPADVVIRDGTFVAIREGYAGDAVERIELDGRLVIPGLVQTAMPGQSTPILTGPEAGVTTVFGPGDALDAAGPPRVLPTGGRSGVIGRRACETADEVLACTRAGAMALLVTPTRLELAALLEEIVARKLDTRHVVLSALPAASVTLLDAVSLAIAAGIPPIRAVQLATLHPDTHEIVDQLLRSVTPGKRADLVVLEALGDTSPSIVTFEGTVVVKSGG